MQHPAFYDDYRNRVQAKLNGSNVHKVNGLLGIVLNGSMLVEYFESKGNTAKAAEHKTDVDATIRQIKILTGVSL